MAEALRGVDIAADTSDDVLLVRLRRGDEEALRELMRRHHRPLVRLACQYVPSSVAEEVVQETWIGLLDSLDRYEGRVTLASWTYRIMLNKARSRWRRERRSVPFAATAPADGYAGAVPADRLDGHPELGAGYWPDAPARWETMPEERLESTETLALIERHLAVLPPAQREVVTLRDVEGWSGPEVCQALGITAANQRVLLHRGRAALRRALEVHLAPDREEAP